ncbi:hypothetical protein OG530_13765 [Streptomyces decoyicus]|uniref:hypothetical protein n=1 Tax=Streptomyces decoyicus TaxID=249567 RepID=UPI002E19E204
MSTAPDHPASRQPRDPHLHSAVGKLFQRVVPLFFVMSVANYVDRVNIGFAQDQLRADVGISALSVVGVLAAAGVGLVRGGGHRERARGRRPRAGDHGPGRGPVRGGPARVR